MNSRVSKIKFFSLLAVVAAGLIACGVGGDTGRLSLSLTDAATDQYHAVYVTIREVAVHNEDDPEDSWTTVATPNKTFNLLSLTNGVREELALADLTPGHYTQLRLIIGDQKDNGVNILSQTHPFANYVVDESDLVHELKVPSGVQTGVKIVQGFEINENRTTELILDFSATRSVVVAGRSGRYLLKPTIKVLDTSLAAILGGTVTKAADQTVVEGALVSAQVYDALAADIKDQVVVHGSTLSADTGAYKLFIAAGAYNLVAHKLGFAPSPAAITVEADTTPTQDFALTAVDSGTVAGTVAIAGANNETAVTLSFRQSVSLGGEDVVIEVLAINVVNGAPYSVDLPAGLYSLVSSTLGKTTQAADVTVTAGATTTLDIAF
jgi:Domain of unknown function (DUF4382)/Carboxypeptidase regulatory-like domain